MYAKRQVRLVAANELWSDERKGEWIGTDGEIFVPPTTCSPRGIARLGEYIRRWAMNNWWGGNDGGKVMGLIGVDGFDWG
jgi:hypothetical protein